MNEDRLTTAEKWMIAGLFVILLIGAWMQGH